MHRIRIGVDPGDKTGLAVMAGGKFLELNTGFAAVINGQLRMVKSYGIVQAMELVLAEVEEQQQHLTSLKLYIEDARKRKWIPTEKNQKQVVGRAKGAGSVSRDCAIWQEFCEFHGIDYELVAPKNNKTKLNAFDFRRLTGWQAVTNQHGRDAAMLIWGR